MNGIDLFSIKQLGKRHSLAKRTIHVCLKNNLDNIHSIMEYIL